MKILALLILIFSINTHAGSLNFRAKNISYNDLKFAEACINYNTCRSYVLVTPSEMKVPVSIIRGQKAMLSTKTGQMATVFQIQVFDLSIEELQRRLGQCGMIDRLQGKLFDEAGKVVTLASPETQSEAVLNKIPAVMNDRFMARNKTALDEAMQLARSEKYVEATQRFIEIFGLDYLGYRSVIKHQVKSGDLAHITNVNHEDKLIELSDHYEPCLFWQSIRHELEHVVQVNHLFQCQEEGVLHYFREHDVRERAAYFGDAAFSSFYCNSTQTKETELNSWEAFKRY